MVGGKGQADLDALLLHSVPGPDFPEYYTPQKALGVPSSTALSPNSLDVSQIPGQGEGTRLGRVGLVPEATPCTTPSRVLLPVETKRSTLKGRGNSRQQAQWLESGQRDPGSMGILVFPCLLGPPDPTSAPSMPASSGNFAFLG